MKGNKVDKASFSLPHWIMETDKKLKTSMITSNPKKPLTPNVKVAPPIFKQYLGISFLTVAQQEILKEECVFLNGPAGAGKTVLIQGKIIHLVKERGVTEKIVVFLFGENMRKYTEKVTHLLTENIKKA